MQPTLHYLLPLKISPNRNKTFLGVLNASGIFLRFVYVTTSLEHIPLGKFHRKFVGIVVIYILG